MRCFVSGKGGAEKGADVWLAVTGIAFSIRAAIANTRLSGVNRMTVVAGQVSL